VGWIPFWESKLMEWAVHKLATRSSDYETRELRACRSWDEARPIAEAMMARALKRHKPAKSQEILSVSEGERDVQEPQEEIPF